MLNVLGYSNSIPNSLNNLSLLEPSFTIEGVFINLILKMKHKLI